MYTIFILSLLFLGHILGDFYFQNDYIANEKKNDFKILVKHSLHQLIISSLLMILFFEYKALLISIFIFVSHIIIDKAKICIDENKNMSKSLLFCLDQLAHIVIIILFVPIIKNFRLNTIFIKLLSILRVNYDFINLVDSSIAAIFIFLISFLFFLINGGTILTKLFIKEYETIGSKDQIIITPPKNGGGELIGIFERLLIFTLVLLGQFTAISFVITAKSIARFKKIEEDSSFSDKFLIGTLSSFSISFFLAIIFKIIFHSYNPSLYELIYQIR